MAFSSERGLRVQMVFWGRGAAQTEIKGGEGISERDNNAGPRMVRTSDKRCT